MTHPELTSCSCTIRFTPPAVADAAANVDDEVNIADYSLLNCTNCVARVRATQSDTGI